MLWDVKTYIRFRFLYVTLTLVHFHSKTWPYKVNNCKFQHASSLRKPSIKMFFKCIICQFSLYGISVTGRQHAEGGGWQESSADILRWATCTQLWFHSNHGKTVPWLDCRDLTLGVPSNRERVTRLVRPSAPPCPSSLLFSCSSNCTRLLTAAVHLHQQDYKASASSLFKGHSTKPKHCHFLQLMIVYYCQC